MGRLKTLPSRLRTLPARVAPASASTERIRGRVLQRIREAHFRDNPMCVSCLRKDIARYATQLDHIVALVNGGKDVPENRQGLCDDCHEVKTKHDIAIAAGRAT